MVKNIGWSICRSKKKKKNGVELPQRDSRIKIPVMVV